MRPTRSAANGPDDAGEWFTATLADLIGQARENGLSDREIAARMGNAIPEPAPEPPAFRTDGVEPLRDGADEGMRCDEAVSVRGFTADDSAFLVPVTNLRRSNLDTWYAGVPETFTIDRLFVYDGELHGDTDLDDGSAVEVCYRVERTDNGDGGVGDYLAVEAVHMQNPTELDAEYIVWERDPDE